MKNVYIYCEGQAEESFVNEILSPYFANMMIFVIPIVHTTKRTPSKKHRGGGVNDYGKIKSELTALCKSHPNEYVTTMFDYYRMSDRAPAIDCAEPDIFKRMVIIEQAITQDINAPNFFFNFMLHEFEAILFSDPDSFSVIADETTVEAVRQIRNDFQSPEHINNSYATAPSKRLEALTPNYAKVRNGTLVSKNIGIDKILQECKHFSDWIEKIKAI